MRKSHSKLRKVLPIVAGLAGIGTGFASAQDMWNRTWDAISLSDNKYEITLTPDSKTNLTYLLGQGNGKFVDPVIGTRNVIESIKNSTYFTPKQKEIETARYQKILTELTKREIGSYYLASLDLLNGAVKDKTLEPVKDGLYSDGKWKIYDGVFMLISSPDCNNWSYPIYIDLKLKENKLEQAVQTPAQKKDAPLPEVPKTPETQCKPEAYGFDLTKPIPEAGYYPLCLPQPKVKNKCDLSILYGGLPGFPFLLSLPEVPKPSETQFIPKTPKETVTPKKDKDYRGISLLTQAASNTEFDSYSASLGVRFNPFKKADVGFGAILNAGCGLDDLVDEYTGPLSAGRTAYGTITNTNNQLIGGSLEAQFGPFFVDIGANYQQWIKRVVEEIKDSSGDLVKSNTNSTPNRQVFGNVSGGVEIPLGNKFKLRLLGGYDGRNGGYFGAGGTVKLK